MNQLKKIPCFLALLFASYAGCGRIVANEIEVAEGASTTVKDDLLVEGNINGANVSAGQLTGSTIKSGVSNNDGFYSTNGLVYAPRSTGWKTIYTFPSNAQGLFAIATNLQWTDAGAAMLVFIRSNKHEQACCSHVLSNSGIGNYSLQMNGLHLQVRNDHYPANVRWSISKISKY